MELMEALSTRRSVRRYSTRPVDRATIGKLLEAAVQAPSAGNSQPWAFGVILGAEKLRAYHERAKALYLAQPDLDPAFRARLADPAFSIFHGAPALVAIYAKSSGYYARTDCALAAQNLMLAAHALGLGTCWIGRARPLFETPEFAQELGVPEGYSQVAQLIVGYPEGEAAPRPRKPPEVVFWE